MSSKILLFIAVLITFFPASANQLAMSNPPGIWTGPSTVYLGEQTTYSYDNGLVYIDPTWYASRGTIISSSVTGTTYSVTIEWTSTGSATIEFAFDGDVLVSTKSVTVNPIPTPNTTFTTQSNCGNSVITRNTNPLSSFYWYWQTSASGTSTALGNGSSVTVTTSGNLYLRARQINSPYNWSTSSQSVGNITVASLPAAPTANHTHSITDAGFTATFSINAVSGANGYKWYTSNTEPSPITGATTTSYSSYVSATKTLYAEAYKTTGSLNCSSTPRTAVTANVYPVPVISTTDGSINMGSSAVLTVSNFAYDTYQWINVNPITLVETNISGATSASLTTSQTGVFKVRVTKGSATYTTGAVQVGRGASGQLINYIVSNTIQRAGVFDESEIDTLRVKSNSQVIQYFDDLGRPLQTVTTQGSPLKKDVVQPFVYDGFGREYRKYLPIVANTTSGWYKAGIIDGTGNYTGLAANFYSNNLDGKIAQDPKPYSETIFETSPLNRPLKSYEVGSAWSAAENDKYVASQYPINVHGAAASPTAEKIIAWGVNSSNLPVRRTAVTGFIDTNGYYSSGQITIKTNVDEDGNICREYMDKKGRIILKKTQIVKGSSNLNSSSDWALTYNIYDHNGNIVFVLPPELSKLAHSTDSYTISALEVNNWAFQYIYDARQRLIIKKLPGAGSEYFVYDDRNRIVLTQDANQRSGTNKYWSFTKFDAFNRPALTGILTADSVLTQAKMQRRVDQYYLNLETNNGAWFETYKGSVANNVHGYDNKSYPVETNAANYLTITYYDNYSFKAILPDSSSFSFNPTHLSGQQPSCYNRVTDKVTGSKTKVLDGGVVGGNIWLTTINYYDDKYQVVQTVSANYKGGVDRTTSRYDFAGKVTKTRTTHDIRSIVWKDPSAGLIITGNKLQRTATGGSWTVGAASQQQLPASTDGWFEFISTETTTNKIIGLADTNPDYNYTTIDYAFYLNGTSLKVYENNSLKHTAAGALTPGEVLRIQRTGTTVKYYRNGTLIYTSLTASSTLLMVDVSIYTNSGTVLAGKTSFGITPHTVTRSFEYDHAGRLLKIWHRLDNYDSILLVKNEYNELGQLVDKRLHSTVASGANAKQSVDYRYNIRGWLTKMNESDLSGSGEPRDLFGMQLAYNDDIGVPGTAQYNGNISAIKWSNNLALGTVKENAYTYSYDAMSRITASVFKEKTVSWSAAANNGNAETGFTYDLNGNILTLQRNDKRASGWMDNLSYTYSHATEGTSNKLRKVTDTGDAYKGFTDGSNASVEYTYDANGNMITDLNKGLSTAITYNTLDLPEIITRGNNTVTYIYNASGNKLAQVVNFGGISKQTSYIGEYMYEDDALQYISHDEGRIVVAKTETSYANSMDVTTGVTASNATLAPVTQNGTEKYVRATSNGTVTRTGIFPINSAISVTAGETYRIRAKGYRTGANSVHLLIKASGTDLNWPGAALANGATAESWTEQIVTIPVGATILEAGVVWNTVTNGQQFFLNEFEIIKLSANATPEYQYNLKDHLGNVRLTFTTKQDEETALATLETANAAAEQSKFIYYNEAVKINTPLFDHTNAGSTYYSTRLTGGSTNEKYGLAKSLSVMPGDTLNIEVYAKYLDTNSSNWTTALNNLISSIVNGTAPAGTFVDGGAAGSIGTQNFPYVGTLQRSNDNGTGPKAYLNYIIFNRDFVYQTGGFVRVTTAAKEAGTDVAHERLAFDNLVITEPGYIYIYLSNENETNVEVYFDDFKVEHIKSPIIQSDDYYAFGLKFNSFQKENSIINKYLFNEKELQDALDLGWFDFGFRMYDPSIARWNSIDPLTELYDDYSTYHYALNNPVLYKDILGMGAEEKGKEEEDKRKENQENEGGKEKQDRDKDKKKEKDKGQKDKKENKDKDQGNQQKDNVIDTEQELMAEMEKKGKEGEALMKEVEAHKNDKRWREIEKKIREGKPLSKEDKTYIKWRRLNESVIFGKLARLKYEWRQIHKLIKAREKQVADFLKEQNRTIWYRNIINQIEDELGIPDVELPPGYKNPTGDLKEKLKPAWPRLPEKLPYPLKY